MKVVSFCPDCHAAWRTIEVLGVDRLGDGRLTLCCPDCHARRRTKIAAVEARCPSAESLGLVGSAGDLPASRTRRPSADGKRMVRKPEIFGG